MNMSDYLETEEDVPASDLEEFVDRMESMKVERGSDEWQHFGGSTLS